MPRPSFRQLATASLASAILAIGLPAIASAQTAAAPQWLRFTVDTVKPEMAQEYEGYKKQLAAAYKKAGQPIYAVLTNFAGNRNEYTTVVFVAKFGDMDGPNPIAKAIGEEAFANLVRGINRSDEGSRSGGRPGPGRKSPGSHSRPCAEHHHDGAAGSQPAAGHHARQVIGRSRVGR